MRKPKRYYSKTEYKLLLGAKQNRTSGVPDRKLGIVGVAAARVAYNNFWRVRGFNTPPVAI